MWPDVFKCLNVQIRTKSLNFFGVTTIQLMRVRRCDDHVGVGGELLACLVVYVATGGGVDSSISHVLSLSDGATGASEISRSRPS